MRRKFGIICMFLGVILVALAFSLILFNIHEDKKAGKSAEDILLLLQDEIPDEENSQNSEETNNSSTQENKIGNSSSQQGNENSNSKQGNVSSSQKQNSNFSTTDQSKGGSGFSMPVTMLKGYPYIGYVSLPTIDRKLPVMSDWTYPRLRISPCRFSGSTETDDLVILAHNYNRHFGPISSLKQGDPVFFTDLNGIVSIYEVVETDTLNPTAVEEMTSGEWDLTLFTCTYGGKSRVAVRCMKSHT